MNREEEEEEDRGKTGDERRTYRSADSLGVPASAPLGELAGESDLDLESEGLNADNGGSCCCCC